MSLEIGEEVVFTSLEDGAWGKKYGGKKATVKSVTYFEGGDDAEVLVEFEDNKSLTVLMSELEKSWLKLNAEQQLENYLEHVYNKVDFTESMINSAIRKLEDSSISDAEFQEIESILLQAIVSLTEI